MSEHQPISVGGVPAGGGAPLFLIAGPCVIESDEHVRRMAGAISKITRRLKLPLIFKSSFDKANRTSLESYRGPGLEKGLETLRRVKQETGVPVLTDVHEVSQVESVSSVCDVIQIPAFLSRQTDLLVAAGRSGATVNIKKGQFVSPQEVRHGVEKIRSTGNKRILVTERGSSFGYNNLVVDMRSFPVLAGTGCPVIFDVTHSVQLPGGRGTASGGQPEFIEPLARAGCAVGVDGIFLEVHDRPARARSDGSNALALDRLPALLERLGQMAKLVRSWRPR